MMTRSRRIMIFVVLALCSSAAGTAIAADPVAVVGDDLDQSCGPPPPGHPTMGRRDYRARDLNRNNQRDWRFHEYYHLRPAEAQLRSGKNLQDGVMNNLHFVLHKVPNNEEALRILIEWDLAGGSQERYALPRCYFAWARQFAPDDVVVWNYGAYYFMRKGETDRAEQWWQQTIHIDPDNAEAHYNLGLLALRQSDYDMARTHAWAAYANGYPLPGLRESLVRAGQWRDAPVGSSATVP